jgi:hypothetical protein
MIRMLGFREPHVEVDAVCDGDSVHIRGTFHHRSCARFSIAGKPFVNLSCFFCSAIPLVKDFRMRVVREERSLEKRGSHGTGDGRKLGYLAPAELSVHSHRLKRELCLHKMYW